MKISKPWVTLRSRFYLYLIGTLNNCINTWIDLLIFNACEMQRRALDGGELFVNEDGPYKCVADVWDHED